MHKVIVNEYFCRVDIIKIRILKNKHFMLSEVLNLCTDPTYLCKYMISCLLLTLTSAKLLF